MARSWVEKIECRSMHQVDKRICAILDEAGKMGLFLFDIEGASIKVTMWELLITN